MEKRFPMTRCVKNDAFVVPVGRLISGSEVLDLRRIQKLRDIRHTYAFPHHQGGSIRSAFPLFYVEGSPLGLKTRLKLIFYFFFIFFIRLSNIGLNIISYSSILFLNLSLSLATVSQYGSRHSISFVD
jgi:hypothetical protein